MASLEDVQDVERFAATVARRLLQRAPEDEVQEAAAEGVALLYELHGVWDPERCASFYRYCTTYLQLRLIDWWRKESRQRNLAHRSGDGYEYMGRVSLDGFVEDLEDQREAMPAALVGSDSHRLGD